jgi:hypothetical protein
VALRPEKIPVSINATANTSDGIRLFMIRGDYIQEDVANHRKVYNNFAQTIFFEEDQIQEWPQGRYKNPRPSLKKRE